MATATRTVLFTDLANYTARVSRADREELRRMLTAHEAMVRPPVEAQGGRVVKNIGDSFMCLFPAATDALKAALAVMEKSAASDASMIRIALSTGDLEQIDDDAFGETVNLAARILDKTPAGEVWFGAGTRVCMHDSEIPWELVGRFELKGIPGEQKCYRMVLPRVARLPEPIAKAAGEGRLVRVRPGISTPALPPDPVVLFEGFAPGSAELDLALQSLPVVEPRAIYLAVYQLATSDRNDWTRGGRGLVVGTPGAIDVAITRHIAAARRSSAEQEDLAETMSLAVLRRTAQMEVVLCGLALPAVPLMDIVAGYTYDLTGDGTWVAHSDSPLLRVEVGSGGVQLRPLSPHITVAGHVLQPGQLCTLSEAVTIGTPVGDMTYRPLGDGYAGMLLADTPMRLGMNTGQTVEIGRQPNPPGLAFPARPGADNILWCTGNSASAARAGGFTLDRALAGRRQAAIHLTASGLEVEPLHAECPTYLLSDSTLRRARTLTAVGLDDLIVVGTNVATVRRNA